MPGYGYGYGPLFPARRGGGQAPAILRTVPIDAYEGYVIAPHDDLGAIALHLIYGNGDNPVDQNPPDSLGAPFGGWRIRGFRTLPTPESNPETEYNEIIYSGVGSQEYAINVNNVYGGTYHGGLDDYVQTGPDVTAAGMLSSLRLDHTATINWSGGEVAQVMAALQFMAQGVTRTTARMVCPYNTLTAALALFQLSTAYKRASTDQGETWFDISTVGYYDMTAFGEVWWRNPSTGTIAKVVLDASGADNLDEVNFDVSAQRVKYRARFDTPGSGETARFGDQTVIADYSFGYLSHDFLLPISTNYDDEVFSAYLSPAGAGGYTVGVDYNAFMDIEQSLFPARSRIRTIFPDDSHPPVWGYFFVAKGDYRNSPGNNHPPAVQIGSLSSFVETFDFEYEGSANFSLLSENWLTSIEGNWSTITYEIGWFYRYDRTGTHWFLWNHGDLIGDYNDGTRSWRVRFHPNANAPTGGAGFCTFALNDVDLLAATIDKKAAIDWLLTQSAANPAAVWALDANWWMNGTAFGIEVTDGGGETAMTINAFDAIWAEDAPPVTVSVVDSFDAVNPGQAGSPLGWTRVTAPAPNSVVSGGNWTATGIASTLQRFVRDTPLQPGAYHLEVDYSTAAAYSAGGIKIAIEPDGSGTGAIVPTSSFNSPTPTTKSLDFVVAPGQLGYITFEASTSAGRAWTASELRYDGTLS